MIIPIPFSWRSLVAQAQCVAICVIAGLTAFSNTPACADEPSSPTAKVLADCAAVKLSAALPMREAILVTPNGVLGTRSDPTEEYLPISFAPATDDSSAMGNPARVRLLLTGPLEKQVIDLLIYVDGHPFRTLRDRWIDRRLAANRGEEKPDPSQVPTPEAAKDASPVALASGQFRASNPTVGDRLTHFLAAVGQPVERDEVVSLLEQWPAGYPLLLLTSGASWRRTNRAPLVSLLDIDQDGSLSAAEIRSASETLKKGDVNQDGIFELPELERVAPARATQAIRRPLLVLLDPLDPSAEIALASGSLDRKQLQALRSAPANITLQVDFQTNKESTTRLKLTGLEPGKGRSLPQVIAGESVIAVDYGSEYAEISAIESDTEGAANNQPEQIAVGAAVDGYPLFRLLDADENRQLTGREARRLPELLAELDGDRNGAVSADEIPTAVRLAVSRAPLVDRQLAFATSAVKARVKADSATQAPAWFTSMDANRDGDLSRQEFSGTAEQFQALDADRDGLVSAAEAIKTEKSK